MGEGVNVMDDRRIIGLFLERSEQAIDALSTKYGDLCHHIARNIVGNEQDADECVSDAYLALWDSIPPEKPQFLRAYVTKVLRNIAYDRLDRRTAQMRDARLEVCLEELAECLPGDQSEQAMLDSILIREKYFVFYSGTNRSYNHGIGFVYGKDIKNLKAINTNFNSKKEIDKLKSEIEN